VEFLSDEQVAAYGRFAGERSVTELERFFYLDDFDRDLVAGGALISTGWVSECSWDGACSRRFLEDPLDVPWAAVELLAAQLEISDASCVKKYVQRAPTAYEHSWEIRDRYGYRPFDDADSAARFSRFLDGRAWTHFEGRWPCSIRRVGWLRRNGVLLRGVSVLARQVAAARDAAETRLHEALADRWARNCNLLHVERLPEGRYEGDGYAQVSWSDSGGCQHDRPGGGFDNDR
jgi:hypothetical protein